MTLQRSMRIFKIGIMLILVCMNVSGEIRENRWRWSAPLPHGNNILDMYVSEQLAIQVGDAGTLYIDDGSGHWAIKETGVNSYLRGTALMGNRLIAVGENGSIIWSDDFTQFQSASIATANWFEGVAATAQKAVAVGDFGMIYTTTDGNTWNSQTSGTTEWLRGVAFGNSAFVAVGENGTILRSSESGSWTSIPSGTTADLNRVRYLGSAGTGTFYATGNNGTLLSSATGNAPWTTIPTGTTNHLNDIAMNTSGLLLVGDGEVLLKPTGSTDWINQITELTTNAPPDWNYICAASRANTWLAAGRTGLLLEGTTASDNSVSWKQSPSYSSHAWLWDITLQDGIYIAVGDLAHIQTSLDGILWTREVVPESQTNAIWLGVGGNSNSVLAVGSDGQVSKSLSEITEHTVTNEVDGLPVITNIFVNSLGVVWETVPSYTDQTLQGIDASDLFFITTGAGGTIFTSSDMQTWVQQTSPVSTFLSSVAIGPESCVAVGAEGTLLSGSSTGTSWKTVELDLTEWLYRVRYLNEVFIVVGENGSIYTSPNGTKWTARSSGTDRWLTDIDYMDGQWIISGYQGTLLSSTNLTDWTPHAIPTRKSLYGIDGKNGQLITVGAEGITLRNPIIPNTTPVEILGYSQSIVAEAGTTNSYELFLFGGQPDQIFEFQYSTNLTSGWITEQQIELYDRSGALYLIQTRPETNMPSTEFSRAKLIP